MQAEKDRILLSTYTSEDDILRRRDGALAAIDSRIKHSEQVTAGLQDSLAKLQSRAAKRERRGKTVDERLLRDIDGTRKQIADNKAFVEARNEEKDEINKAFDSDLARWRELRGD